MNLRTAPATIALGTGGLLLLVALSWVFVLSPKLGALADTSEQSTALQDSNLSMTVQLAGLRELADDVAKMQQKGDALALVIPATANQPGFFRAVTTAAQNAGLPASALTSVSPGVPVLPVAPAPAVVEEGAAAVPAAAPEPQVAVQEISINIDGSYDQLATFLDNLESMDRALLVQSIDLSANEESLSLTVSGATFVAPPLGAPPSQTP